jgi:hypothetical protein
MTHYINGHRVTFHAHGQITVDDKLIALGVNMANGGHYTYKRDDQNDATASLAGRKLTGPKRPVGKYEAALATEIVAALFPANE